jgi:hypothetical protein
MRVLGLRQRFMTGPPRSPRELPPLEWSWQLPPPGDEEGLEGYRVADVNGRPIGSVGVLLRRQDEIYLVVSSGAPFNPEFHAVPLDRVAFADHERCTVGLMVSREDLPRSWLLSRRLAVRDGLADAARVTTVPPLSTMTSGAARPPAGSGPFALRFSLAAVALLALLAVVIFASAPWDPWEFGLFGIPVVLLLLALAFSRLDLLGRRGSGEARAR